MGQVVSGGRPARVVINERVVLFGQNGFPAAKIICRWVSALGTKKRGAMWHEHQEIDETAERGAPVDATLDLARAHGGKYAGAVRPWVLPAACWHDRQ